MSEIPLLTAVIPVTKMKGKLESFKSTISDCKELGVGLVVVHDKRDSETGPELLSLLKEFGPAQSVYVENEYGSAAGARNAGLRDCKSPWIAFWDSDDNVYVNEFLKMVQLAESQESEVAIGKLLVKKQKNEIAVESPSLINDKKLDLQISNFPGFTRMGFKRSILSDNLFPEIPIGEDLIFLLRVNPVGRKITLVDNVVYCYQVGDANQATKNYVGEAPFILLLTNMALFLQQSSKKEIRLCLAFVDKLLLSLARKALRGDISGHGIAFMLKIMVYNFRFPVHALQILFHFFTNRPRAIAVIHGK
jgi:hypothetical protein